MKELTDEMVQKSINNFNSSWLVILVILLIFSIIFICLIFNLKKNIRSETIDKKRKNLKMNIIGLSIAFVISIILEIGCISTYLTADKNKNSWRVEINTITEAHKILSQQLNSNNQAVSAIRATGNLNNEAIKGYAEDTYNADEGIGGMVDEIAELFRAIGDSLQRYPQGVFLRDSLNNGARRLEDRKRGYLNNIIDAKTTLKQNLAGF